ncbi:MULTISPECIES: hypothetical protein [unclassified Microcystis]|uniref:hypothetical protein n=1 Tax=unclassified Microcystis TaxID=2643300 RepID=UPI00119662CC|nr:hypothetical protein [Microcystis sp. M065S2]TRT74589.1 MAG: hypothetical protein EWV84_03140 [Microcystis sp. M_QC_C_20170808_M3Col]
MRNVNLNILKVLELINNFCLSLSNIGLEVQETVFRRLFLFILPTPLHPTPYTPHPTPYTPHPTPHFLISFSNDSHRFFQSNK